METYDDPIPRKKKGKKLTKNCKSESMKADEAEKGRTYGIDHLNLAHNLHDLENDFIHEADNASVNDSKRFLSQRWIGHM